MAADVVKTARGQSKARDRLTTTKEIGAVLFAMVNAEKGVTAVSKGSVTAAIKKELPSAT